MRTLEGRENEERNQGKFVKKPVKLTNIHIIIPAKSAMTTVKIRIGFPSKTESKMAIADAPSSIPGTRKATPGESTTGKK